MDGPVKKIQATGKTLWIYDWTADKIRHHYKELDPCLVGFSLNVKTQDEADLLLEWLVKNTWNTIMAAASGKNRR